MVNVSIAGAGTAGIHRVNVPQRGFRIHWFSIQQLCYQLQGQTLVPNKDFAFLTQTDTRLNTKKRTSTGTAKTLVHIQNDFKYVLIYWKKTIPLIQFTTLPNTKCLHNTRNKTKKFQSQSSWLQSFDPLHHSKLRTTYQLILTPSRNSSVKKQYPF